MQEHRASVIDFDLLGESSYLAGDGIDLAHEPDCKVRDVDTEIEHRAAARFRSRREPFLSRRPKLRSAMRKPRADEVRLADCATGKRVLDGALDSAEAPLHRDHQHPASFRGRVDHLARLGRGWRHRLFDEHVRARIERLDGKFTMQIVRREDADRVGALARQHFVEVGIDFRTARVVGREGSRNAFGFGGGAGLYRDDWRVGNAGERRNVRALGNRTGAGNRNPDHRTRPRRSFDGFLLTCPRGGPVESSIHWMYGGEPRSAFNARTSGTS